MSNTKTTIELNGKKYDARTGQLINDVAPAVKHAPMAPKRRLVTDVTPAHQPVTVVAPPAQKATSSLKTRVVQSDVVPSHSRHQKTQKAKTLMRSAVKKPHQKTAHHVSKPSAPASHVPPVKTATVHHERLNRAQQVERSHLIRKFASSQPFPEFIKRHEIVPVVQPVEVTTPPVAVPVLSHQAAAIAQTHHKDIFESALHRATSHKEKPVKLKNRAHHRTARKLGISSRALNVGASVLVVLVLGAFIAYQNVPNFAMRVAAARAGVPAQMPGYKPSGFAMNGPIQYRPGQITVSFAANGDNNRSFSVTQKTSNWNSEALLTNHVVANSTQYQTYQENGRTIYVYDESSAAWVDGGIMYEIAGDAGLTSDQLLRMAASL